MLTNEELTYPRYKVLVDYPDSNYHVGQVIVFNHKEKWFSGELDWVSDFIISRQGGRVQICIKSIETYPQVFQLLKWYEERTPEEMPQYIKYKDNNNSYIEKLIAHNFDTSDKIPHFKTRRLEIGLYYHNTQAEPATKQEYIKFTHKSHKLFQPRYRVVKDYPYSPYEVGQVIINPPIKDKRLLDAYPEFYQRLMWYEERHELEMPNYLRHTKHDEIYKVIQATPDQVFIESIVSMACWSPYGQLEPATLDDWEDYKQQNIF